MHSQLETYLQDTNRYLKTLPPQVRDGELDEIASHLHQSTADLVAEGYSEAEAAKIAIARFGTSRSIGLRLRDVWEGNRSLWLTLAIVIGSNWALQFAYAMAAIYSIFLLPLHNERLVGALTPLVVVWFVTSFFLLPMGWSFILGRWGGRRVVMATLLAFLPWLVATYGIGNWTLSPLWTGWLTMAFAFSGAWGGSTKKRRHRMALIGGASLEEASFLLSQAPSLRKRLIPVLYAALAVILLTAMALAWSITRIQDVLHPPTPEAAVTALLYNPSMSMSEMGPSTGVVVRLLPATTQERARGVRHVAYSATMHATDHYRRRRIEFYQQILHERKQGIAGSYPIYYVRASLARLGPEGYRVSGVLRVKKTVDGWQADTSGDSANQSWAWLYDVYYEKPK